MVNDVNRLPEGFKDAFERMQQEGACLPKVGIRSAIGDKWVGVGYTVEKEYAILIARALNRVSGWTTEVWELGATPQRIDQIPGT